MKHILIFSCVKGEVQAFQNLTLFYEPKLIDMHCEVGLSKELG